MISEEFTIRDTNNLIIYFLDIKSILTLATVSKNLNKIVKNHPLYDALIKFIKSGNKNISNWACANNHIEILHWRNDYMTIEKFTKKGIFLAAKFGHLEVVKYLISVGENIHACSNNHIEILHWRNDYMTIEKFTNEGIFLAATFGHLNIVKFLISVGANIHAKDDYALQYSAQIGHFEVVKYLISVGANIHAANDYALRWSAEKWTFRSC